MASTSRLSALFATTAMAALVLTGCVQSLDDGQTQDQAATEEPTAQESAAPETSASAASGEVPEDLSEGDISTALSTEIGGYPLVALTPAQLESSGVDVRAEISSGLGSGMEVAPVSCEDPFLGSFLAGAQDADESVVAVDEEGNILVTVKTFDDASAAEQAFQQQRDALEECSSVELTVDGSGGDAEVSVEEITVDGASSAYEASISSEGESFVNPSMAYGNTVVEVATTEQYAGGAAPDNEALLAEVAQALTGP